MYNGRVTHPGTNHIYIAFKDGGQNGPLPKRSSIKMAQFQNGPKPKRLMYQKRSTFMELFENNFFTVILITK